MVVVVVVVVGGPVGGEHNDRDSTHARAHAATERGEGLRTS